MDHNATLAEIPEELKRKDLVMNILKNGQWGSFRHVPGKLKKTHNTRYLLKILYLYVFDL